MSDSTPARFAALLAALAVLGCGSSTTSSGAAGPAPTPAPSNEASAEADARAAELEALYLARLDSARMRFTQADADFMTGMIAHHAQALVMAGLAPDRDPSQAMSVLTARIINAQQDEIATMQGWLRDRGQPVPEVHIDGLEVMLHGVPEHHMHMPGMLSQAQLEELAAARGPAFDRLFLTYMIQHHEGAVTMVHELFATDGAGQDELAFKIATDIQADQTTEIARMQLMLDAMGPTAESTEEDR